MKKDNQKSIKKIKKWRKWSKNLKISKKLKKTNFFLYIYFFKENFCQKKKCCPLSFWILGGRDSTKALQSSPFQRSRSLGAQSDLGACSEGGAEEEAHSISKEHDDGEKLRIRIKPGWHWSRLTGMIELKNRIKAFNEKLLVLGLKEQLKSALTFSFKKVKFEKLSMRKI